jgi:hypothetical protein
MKKLMQHFPAVLVAILIAALAFTETAIAQNPSQVAIQQAPQASPSPFPNGPIPPQIATARKVFLTNAGADHNFPVDENTAYNDVLIALQNWGHYQFVSSPQDAELIFSLKDAAPITGVAGDANSTYSVSSPAFILTIVDAHTNTPLWTVTSPVVSYGSGKKEARWFTLSVNNLVTRVKVLAGQPVTAEEQANLTTFPKTHRALLIGVLVGSFAGLAVAGVLIGKHLSSDWAANAKEQQDAFCKANNIPLTMCAGG